MPVKFPKYSTLKKFLLMIVIVYYVLAILCFVVSKLADSGVGKGKVKILIAILWLLTWAPVISAIVLIIVFYATEK